MGAITEAVASATEVTVIETTGEETEAVAIETEVTVI
jgi:hypothetical protein